jgi:penicillin amidase
MHLSWSVPHIWYEAHLVCENTGLNTYGFTVSGVPLPIVAHNEHIAWGMTNSQIDVMDWYYYEQVDEDTYIYNNTETEFTYKNYTINVKGSSPEEYSVRETVHGPVMNDFLYQNQDGEDTLNYTNSDILATQWTLYNITNTFRAIYGFNHATNLTEFNEASKFFDNPGQNLVYADIEGNIQMRPTALTPIRDDSKIPGWHLGNGSMPYNGSAGSGDWIGYVPLEELPVSTNPDQKYLASANQISVGPNWTSHQIQPRINVHDGFRGRRINHVLSTAPDGTIDIEFMKDLLFDTVAIPAQEFTPIILEDMDNFYGVTKPGEMATIYSLLSAWDGDMDKDETAPSIYRAWRDKIRDSVFADERNTYAVDSYPRLNILEFLMKENVTSHWFDDVTTTPKVENRTDCVIQALDDAMDLLTTIYGSSDPNDWRYGEIHQVEFRHITGIGSLGLGPFENSGSGYTVNPSGFSLLTTGGRPARSGASERMIIDFSDLNNSLTVIPGGQRGVASSRHYGDQLIELFLVGELHPQWFSNIPSNFPSLATESTLIFRGGA